MAPATSTPASSSLRFRPRSAMMTAQKDLGKTVSHAMTHGKRQRHIGRHVCAIPVVEWPGGGGTRLRLDHGFAEVADVPEGELPRLLDVHFAPLLEHGQEVSESCPLFGGLILEVDSMRLIYPQCCGDLSDVTSWLDPAYSASGEALVATGGHPCPEIIREGDMVRLVCFDAHDPFRPPVDCDVVVPAASLRKAVVAALEQLAVFASRLNCVSDIRAHPGLASLLAGSNELPC